MYSMSSSTRSSARVHVVRSGRREEPAPRCRPGRWPGLRPSWTWGSQVWALVVVATHCRRAGRRTPHPAPHRGCQGDRPSTTRARTKRAVIGAEAAVAEGHRVRPRADHDPDQRRRHHDRRRGSAVDGGVPTRVVGGAEDDGGPPIVWTTAPADPLARSACSTTTRPGDPSRSDGPPAVGVRPASVEGDRQVALLSSRGESSRVLLCEPTSARVAVSMPVVS